MALLDEAAELLGELPDQAARQAAALQAAERAQELAYAGRVLDLVGELAPDAARMTTAATLAERYGADPEPSGAAHRGGRRPVLGVRARGGGRGAGAVGRCSGGC